MSEPLYETHPNLFGIRPLASLILVAFLLIGVLVVLAGRYLPPELLTGWVPGGRFLDVEIIQYAGAALFAVAGLQLYYWYAVTRFDRLRIMPDELIWTHGFFHKRHTEIKLDSVRTLRFDQTLMQRMLNAGDLTIFTAGDTPELVVRGLRYPDYIRELIKGPAAAA